MKLTKESLIKQIQSKNDNNDTIFQIDLSNCSINGINTIFFIIILLEMFLFRLKWN